MIKISSWSQVSLSWLLSLSLSLANAQTQMPTSFFIFFLLLFGRYILSRTQKYNFFVFIFFSDEREREKISQRGWSRTESTSLFLLFHIKVICCSFFLCERCFGGGSGGVWSVWLTVVCDFLSVLGCFLGVFGFYASFVCCFWYFESASWLQRNFSAEFCGKIPL